MSLVGEFGLGDRELVAFTGAGGKTTLLLALGKELTTLGKRTVLGTTTRMGTDQIPSWADVGSLGRLGPATTFVVESTDGPKVIGSKPEVFDEIFESTGYVLVEADGARRRHIKAPAPHEPVIPLRTTTVVVVAGLGALGHPISEVAHRPDRVAEVVGLEPSDIVTPEAMATLITSVDGGLARVPGASRVVVALTGEPDGPHRSEQLASEILTLSRIERVVVFPFGGDCSSFGRAQQASSKEGASSFEEVWK